MKKYIKNGQIITEGTPISDDNYKYFNPTPELYHSLGWEDYIEPEPVKTLEQVKQEKINHAVGSHDRCGTIVEPMLKPQWFVKMSEIVKPAIKVFKDKLEIKPYISIIVNEGSTTIKES